MEELLLGMSPAAPPVEKYKDFKGEVPGDGERAMLIL